MCVRFLVWCFRNSLCLVYECLLLRTSVYFIYLSLHVFLCSAKFLAELGIFWGVTPPRCAQNKHCHIRVAFSERSTLCTYMPMLRVRQTVFFHVTFGAKPRFGGDSAHWDRDQLQTMILCQWDIFWRPQNATLCWYADTSSSSDSVSGHIWGQGRGWAIAPVPT